MNKNEDSLVIIAEVASMYYEKNISQNEIAKKMYFSKAKVSRLLRKAKELGVVEFKVKYPIERITSLENNICQLFGLKESIIIRNYPEHNDSDVRIKRLGKAAAQYIVKKLHDGMVIGLSWGKTLNQMVNEIQINEKKDITVVQAMGASADSYDEQTNAMNLVRKMVQACGGVPVLLYAPLFVENNIVKKALVKERIIAKTLDKAKKMDYLVTGIADLRMGDCAISWAGYLDKKRKQEISLRGAVGFFCGHFIDENGLPILGDEEDNIIGVSLADIKKIPNVVAVAGGIDKSVATYAALKGGYITCLITDEFIAEKLINLKTKHSKISKN